MNVQDNVIWPSTTIKVCWENPSAANSHERQVIRQAVETRWNGNAGFNFYGWGACALVKYRSENIRVIITDNIMNGNVSPHSNAFGKQLDNMPNGVVLLDRYVHHWDDVCKGNGAAHDQCQAKYAMHEFGHVLGFHHEQGRSDTPASCTVSDARQGSYSKLGPWDPQSVMGYCSDPRLGDGHLSGYDMFYSMLAYGTAKDFVYFFEDYDHHRLGYNTGIYHGSGCQNVFSKHDDIYSAVFFDTGSKGRIKSVRVYEDVHCGGRDKLFSKPGNLDDFNDVVSSFRIYYKD